MNYNIIWNRLKVKFNCWQIRSRQLNLSYRIDKLKIKN